jgi:hypothetical protein
MPLRVSQVLDETSGRPAGRHNRLVPRLLVEPFDNRKHRSPLVFEKVQEGLSLLIWRICHNLMACHWVVTAVVAQVRLAVATAGHYWGAGREPPVPGSLDRSGRPRPLDPVDMPDAERAPERLRPASPRSESPTVADRSDQTDHLATGDPSVRWSKADLRHRLERLPPGHPSSLRSDAPDHDQPPSVSDPDRPTSAEKTEQDSGTPREAEPDLQADAVKRSYWSEVPRFLRAWADHLRRWPAEPVTAAVDRSRDPEGSWRGDGNQYLSPEQHAGTNDEIAVVRRIEEKLTEHMKEVERENSCGGWLVGLEHRLKGDDRLKEKIAERIEHEPDRTAAEAIREINDAIRYTFRFEPASYSDGYWDVKQRLETHGYRMFYSKNHWRDDPEYKGINARWLTPEGQRFEVQFHTAESFHAKQEVTHGAYERSRNPLTGRRERRELEAFQRGVCSFITVPGEIGSIPDFKEDDN